MLASFKLSTLALFLALIGGCATIHKLTAQSTVSECQDLGKELVAQACKRAGEERDKAQLFLDKVEAASNIINTK